MTRSWKKYALLALIPLLISGILDLYYGINYVTQYLHALPSPIPGSVVGETVFIGCFRGSLILLCLLISLLCVSIGKVGLPNLILPIFLALCHLLSLFQPPTSFIDVFQLVAAVLCGAGLAAMYFGSKAEAAGAGMDDADNPEDMESVARLEGLVDLDSFEKQEDDSDK